MACVRSLSHGQPRWPHALTPHWLHIKAQAAREPGRRSRSTMEAGLLSALLGVLVVPWLQVAPVLVDLDRHKIAGFWREVGVASEQSLALNAPKRVQGLFLTVNGSSLVVRAAFNNSGSCETERIVGWEAGIPGKFTFPGHREILVLDTDYERYAIMRMSLLWQGRDFSMINSDPGERGPGGLLEVPGVDCSHWTVPVRPTGEVRQAAEGGADLGGSLAQATMPTAPSPASSCPHPRGCLHLLQINMAARPARCPESPSQARPVAVPSP
ncbi:uncharacterized protein [Oryctolagus cuniculus]|uniref:uncharacterized protein isoform X3 n=1 Tax=Oryctolagus cuniculus TaxID=9986 RepID=UPI003879C5C4